MRDAQIPGHLFDFLAALNERHGVFLELAVISPRIPALRFFHFRSFFLQSPSRVFEAGSEFLNVELFSSKLEAKVLSAEHREKYNNQRPHSSLEGMTPGEFAARCLAPLRPTAYAPQDSETWSAP